VDIIPFVILIYHKSGRLEKQRVYIKFAVNWGDIEQELTNAE
jgi:hypothetical protein